MAEAVIVVYEEGPFLATSRSVGAADGAAPALGGEH
jgi:hypothetical protein